MKRFAKGVQRLSQRAAEIRQVVDTLPARAAELREVVHATAGQVQQLRGDLAAGAAALRLPADADPAALLREVDACAGPLAEAGFAVEGADVDLAPLRRVRVHLARTGDVSPARLRHLLAAQAHRSVAQTLLAGIAQARELADDAETGALAWTHLTIDLVGGTAVRLGWSAATVDDGQASAAGDVSPPMFSQSSFFERRPATPAGAPAPAAIVAPPVIGTTVPQPAAPEAPPPSATPPAPPPSRASALDRFKKMPDLTRRSS